MKRFTRRDFIKTAAAYACLPLALPALAGEEKPNIIFIMADDMGLGDIRAINSSSKIPTPNLDSLAKHGMMFLDAHTPSAVCTPTRYGVLTGRYCWRSRLKRGVLRGYSPHLIEPERATVASVLKRAGFYTGAVGKWHLGMDWQKSKEETKDPDFTRPIKNGPNALGFDFFFGIPASLDFPPYVYVRNDRVVELPTEEQPAVDFPGYIRKGLKSPSFDFEHCLDHLLAQAEAFIIRRAKTSRPFFLYFPMTAPHKPVLPHKRFNKKTKLGPYGDFIVQVDWTVGQVLKTVKQAGIEKNTLVIYTSDNGAFMYRLTGKDEKDHVDDPTIQAFHQENHTSNHIFRGTKADIWEGGHRVPFLAKWPGKIKPGTTCKETICLTDFTATAAEITGIKLKKGEAEDSYSMLGHFMGRPGKKKRPPVIHHSGAGFFAIRDGKWKLVLASGSGGREKPRGKPFKKPYHLYDMHKDPREKNNLIDKYPEIASKLEAAFRKIRSGD
jgi:arylsulfatase A-like enzyme